MEKTELIINYLKELIRSKKPIPTESELAEKFNVSRNISREALKFLQNLGLITSHKGSGYKTNFNISDSMSNIMQIFLDLGSYSYKDIADIREALEIKELFLISSEQLTHEDYDYLYNTVKIMEKIEDPKKIVEADINFHRKISKLSRSRLIYDIMESLAGLRKNYILVPWQNIPINSKLDLITAHKNIIAALNKDDTSKREAISYHYQVANRTIGPKEILYSGIKRAEDYTLNELKDLGLSSEQVTNIFNSIESN